MNFDSVSRKRDNSLKTESVNFKKIPRQSKLFLDFLSDSPSVARFYPETQTAPRDFAAAVLANYKIDRNELCSALREINISAEAGEKTLANIELLRESDCVTVVTGQQAGLFSGALYTIYKALSAIKFCEEIKAQNIKAVPVFWVAEEDHDFEEIRETFLVGREESIPGELVKIENTPKTHKENSPVGFVDLDETIKKTIDEFLANLPKTEFTDRASDLLRRTYRVGETFSTAFAKLLAKIFADHGLILLTPLNSKLKKICAPIFADAIERSDQIVSELLQRNTDLEENNYSPQVLVEEDSFPFFLLTETGERLALRRDLKRGKIKTRKSEIEFEKSELSEIARNSPDRLSPNALLRPVVQDYLLPTIMYFGGAAEIAYFAQNAVIYEILERPVTPVRHRASFTVVEPKHRRTLEKYELDFADLFFGKEKLSAKIVENFLNNGTARVFGEVEEIINAQLDNLDRYLLESDPTLSDNLVTRRRKILWHISALRKKYHRAEMLKNKTANRRIEALFADLFPRGELQERTLNMAAFLNLYGENFIKWVYNAIHTEEKNHQIIYL